MYIKVKKIQNLCQILIIISLIFVNSVISFKCCTLILLVYKKRKFHRNLKNESK